MIFQYGEEVIPLGTYVKRLCLKQSNLKETNTIQQLVYAQQVWKELFRRTIWEVKRAALTVDCRTGTIQKPYNCERILNISVVDRAGRLHPLTPDSDINTVEMRCAAQKCSCKTCQGQGTLCGAMDSAVTYTTQDVVIQGTTYVQQTWIKYDGNGNIVQDINMPILDAASNTVVFQHQISTLCNVETTDKGCIKSTQPNLEALMSYTGFSPDFNGFGGVYGNTYRGMAPTVYNDYGYWNYNAADRSIIHIFRNATTRKERLNVISSTDNPQGANVQTNYHQGIEQVIMAYQINGEEPGEEILIPQYAEAAMDAGVMYLQTLYNMRAPVQSKIAAKGLYYAASAMLNRHLNPVSMDLAMKLQTNARLW